jgi:hypothetical protein
VLALRIDVEDSDQLSRAIEHRNDDLRLRASIAGDVTRKLVHVGDEHRRALRSGGATDTLTELDVEAAERSLVRSDAQKTSRLDDPIEAGPEMTERVVDERADRRHSRDRVVDAGENAVELRLEGGVGRALRNVAEIESDFSHVGAAGGSRSGELFDDKQEPGGEYREGKSLHDDRDTGSDRALSPPKYPAGEGDRGSHRKVADVESEIQPEEAIEMCCPGEVAQLERTNLCDGDERDDCSPRKRLNREVEDQRRAPRTTERNQEKHSGSGAHGPPEQELV